MTESDDVDWRQQQELEERQQQEEWKKKMTTNETEVRTDYSGLKLLRAPFPEHQISKKPVGTKAQNDCPPNEKRNCSICGGWHHPQVKHLDYVGHAALTDRLLDADPLWYWEPFATNKDGIPAFDDTGGLWIRLHVCGHTRIGYGHAASTQYKEIGAREKEVIGDALRNAAMRFGAALELWHKGDLHKETDEPTVNNERAEPSSTETISLISSDQAIQVDDLITETGSDKEKFLAYYKVKFVAELNVSQYAHALATLQKKMVTK